MYEYEADVAYLVDSDTIVVDVSLGFHIWHNAQHLRLAGVSCRELRQPGGREAADVMSFDRYVAVVTLPDGRDLADVLVQAGYACRWDGKTKPTPYPDWPIPGTAAP